MENECLVSPVCVGGIGDKSEVLYAVIVGTAKFVCKEVFSSGVGGGLK